MGVFQDAYPFGSTIVTETLAADGIPYELHTSAEFGTLDFSRFTMILIPSDQPQSFYDAFASSRSKFESYVSDGGFLAVFAASGWNGFGLTVPLPGGIILSIRWENFNNINDPNHPVDGRYFQPD